MARETDRGRVLIAPPSLPLCTIHSPLEACPVMIPTWCGQTTTTPMPGPPALEPTRAHSRARARRRSDWWRYLLRYVPHHARARWWLPLRASAC